ncbi:hypothetical protein BH10BDE1_BH10BDE1_23880 [soil metagenome]
MMQTETISNPRAKSGAPLDRPTQKPTHDPTPSMTRTRCPGCQKLFAVETDTLSSMSRAGVTRAEFTCTGELCHEAFAIELPLPPDYSTLTILPAVRLKPAPETEPIADLVAPAALTPAQPPRSIIAAPLKSAKPSIGFERECPRCGAMNAASMNDCVRCGIIFERYNVTNEAQLEEELALGGTRELSLMWDKTLEDYEDRIRHDRFLNACRDANALSYSSKKYSQILVSAPQDDIARLMRNRIVAMISQRAESSRMPIRLNFRIPKMNTMALFGGSVLFFWGLMMPQLKNIMEIGLSLVLLSIGVRVALRSRI